jgi:enoyl-[acyl-carrier protein] reductase II
MRPTFTTRATRLLGIQHPVIQGPMAWVSPPSLVAAVSNEGGLGVLAASQMPVEEVEAQVVETQRLTDKPFGINFPLLLGEYSAHLEMALARRVPVIFVSAGSPQVMTTRIKQAGATCVHVVPTLRAARAAARAGVDAVAVESLEAGGHLSAEGITGLTNIPLVSRAVEQPVLAAGGIVDGRGMAAALCLGAEAVVMGTRFLATHECNAHPVFKDRLLQAGEGDTPVFSRLHHPGRALRTPLVERVLQMERAPRTTEEIRALVGRGRARRATQLGDVEEGIFFCGAGAAQVDTLLSVREVFDQVLEGCDAALRRVAGLRTGT